MNNTEPHVLDAWIGYKIFVSKKEEEAYKKADGKGGTTGPMSMEDAGEYLQMGYGNEG